MRSLGCDWIKCAEFGMRQALGVCFHHSSIDNIPTFSDQVGWNPRIAADCSDHENRP